MVRLVFRPYTQIRRTICTSVSLRASTRVSPGFTLFRHRSPSFGSQQICSYSNLAHAQDRSMVPPCRSKGSHLSRIHDLYFHYAPGFYTQILAYMLDSLVRVSRRVNENHFASIANTHVTCRRQYRPSPTIVLCTPANSSSRSTDAQPNGACYRSSIPPEVWYAVYNRALRKRSTPTFPRTFSPKQN
jgi:hypothetical protein